VGTKTVGISGEIQTLDGKTKPVYGTEGMVRRAEEAAQRKIEKISQQKEREEQERQQRLEEEKRHREKLLNAKVPEEGRRLTKTAEVRANMVSDVGAGRCRKRMAILCSSYYSMVYC
jgi:hypothetical protein